MIRFSHEANSWQQCSQDTGYRWININPQRARWMFDCGLHLVEFRYRTFKN